MNTDSPAEAMNPTTDTSRRVHREPRSAISRNSYRTDWAVDVWSRCGSEITSRLPVLRRLREMTQLSKVGRDGKCCSILDGRSVDLSRTSPQLSLSMLLLIAAFLITGCATQAVPPSPASNSVLGDSYHAVDLSPATIEALHQFDGDPRTRYLIGPGDRVNVMVWARPELSGAHVVGPDGDIQVPFLGSVRIAEMTPDQASARLSSALSEYYVSAYATITMLSYSGNTVTVLGHVAHPGLLTFNNNPTLLEVLARAGTVQTDSKITDITRCAVFRGKDRALWLDLRPLYRGDNLALNLRIIRGDYVYVPDPSDQLVYVLGQVNKPGAYALTPNMSFLAALAEAGGPSDAAKPSQIVLARPRDNRQQVIDLAAFLAGNGAANYSLEEGDIIYVPKSGLATMGYVLQQLNPITSTLLVGAALF